MVKECGLVSNGLEVIIWFELGLNAVKVILNSTDTWHKVRVNLKSNSEYLIQN